MKVQVERDAHGNIIIQMKGGISYENTSPLREEIQGILSKNPTAAVTINMQNVDFVGSSGIGQFVETLKMVNEDHTKVRLSNVSPEFIKVFKLYQLSGVDLDQIMDDFENDELDGPNHYGRRFNFPS